MRFRLAVCLVTIAAVLMLSSSAAARFYFLETDYLRLAYYGKAHSYVVSHVARCFENSLRFHRQLFNYTPSEKITLVIHDLSDYGNGGAGTCPHNRVSLGIAPISYAYETTPANERINATLNHELVHIMAADQASGSDRFFRGLFGGKVAETSDNPLTIIYSYLTVPRRSAPVWYHEGIAVFMETWMAGGQGRALGSYDEMVFRTMVRDSCRFYSPQGLESEGTKVDFHVGVNSYLYGTRFFSYLAHQYGPEKLVEWTSRSTGSKAHYGLEFNRIYDRSIDATWSDWVRWEKAFQQTNLDSIRQYSTTQYRPLFDKALGSVSQAYYDAADRTLYCAVNYPGQVAHLAAIDIESGSIDRLGDIKGPALFFVTSLAYDSTNKTLYYTADNNGWRDLISLDLKTRRSRTLLKDARLGDLAFNYADSSLWAVRHFNGISSLVRIPYPYEEWNLVRAFPYGKDIYDISISADGTRLAASLGEISGRQTLIALDTDQLQRGDTTYQTWHNFGTCIPSNFVFSAAGRYLYGSSYYTGVSNIFRYDIEADSMDAVSNCETGFFRPVPVADDSLIVFRYNSQGFSPVMIRSEVLEDVNAIRFLGQEVVEKYPSLREWNVGSPASINLDSLVVDSGAHHELASMGLGSGYPVVEGYKDFVAVGARFNFSGALGLDRSSLTASYTPQSYLAENERYHLRWSYSHTAWKVLFKYNAADFYDLFGPTKTSRKGYSLGLRYQRSLLHDPPRIMNLSANVTGFGGLERLPEYQNIITSFDRFLSYGGQLGYQNLRASLGAVDFEKGYRWQLISSNTYVRRKHFPKVVLNIDLGVPLPIHHSSVWLHASAGYAHGGRIQPLANFYFGGFGNNWIDHQAVKRYRVYHSFPGAEINAIAGTNFVRAVTEWNLPPVRFRRLGFPWFFVTWARPSVFASGIITNLEESEEQLKAGNLGSQLDIRMVMLSHLKFTLSFGYAVYSPEAQRGADEFMVSLKVL